MELSGYLDQTGEQITYVNGGYFNDDNRLTVSTLTRQLLELEQVAIHTKRLGEAVAVTHCFGMTAAVAAAQDPKYNIGKIVAISPTYPTPYATATHPYIRERLKDGQLPTFSWSDPGNAPDPATRLMMAKIPSDFILQLEKTVDEFRVGATRLWRQGRLATVHLAYDWNIPARTPLPTPITSGHKQIHMTIPLTHNMMSGKDNIAINRSPHIRSIADLILKQVITHNA